MPALLQYTYSPMMKKSGKRSTEVQKVKKVKKQDLFDQEQENLDALEMEEHDDEEYNALLKSSPHANLKKNAYFFNNERYSGTKQPAQEEKSSEQEEEQQDSEPEKNYLSQALKDLKQQRIDKSKLLTEDVRKIEEQDEQFETIRKQQKTSDQAIQESLCLKGQLDLFKDLVDLRYNKQNELQLVKKFPINNFPQSKELHQSHKTLQEKIFQNLNNLIDLYHSYSEKVFQSNEEFPDFNSTIQEEQNAGRSLQKSKLGVENLYNQFTSAQSGLTKETEKQLVKWSQKTALLNVSASHYSSLLMQTPVGQAKKVIEQWTRASSKCQQKRSTFKILFQNEEDIRSSSNPQIFDDYELFNELEKIYVSEVEDENDFRISDTLRYLKNREARGEKTKEVDRKASKNRKLRFNVHAKLLNFMPSRPANEIQARDEIVSNIFNCKAGLAQPKTRDEETYYIDI